MQKPKSVEAYFESLPDEQRTPLQKLRETIAPPRPRPTRGSRTACRGSCSTGAASSLRGVQGPLQLLPDELGGGRAHRDELGSRVTGKGTISFEYGGPLPTALVKKVVRTRLAEATARRAKRK